MIDKNTGQLTFGTGKTVFPITTLSELKAINLSAVHEEGVLGNEWIHYTVKNVLIAGKFFYLTFFFHEEILDSVSFIFNDCEIDLTSNWDCWSEKREKENAVLYNNWLDKEIGTSRNFLWGTVWASYDPKSGGSSIGISYK
ncbi:hypothetical protein AHMF7605_19955 [Adhaeribacter arboris]|uniref:Uncharacterized protein n=1 Tax=Adhaeribacter arboris TaxID=2072846 RepID=A0A2T2YJD5_9BACT|nr:hypothetical protein [Adhaeribacter arboris]PSR55618.1 hypothetical protein AHMF7605_19955 [Adhaeribacter arboris]